MPEMMARVEVEDFDTWLSNHLSQSGKRAGYGMKDGPIYRDIDDANAAFVHLDVQDLAKAREWFQTEEFARSTKKAGVVRREFFITEVQK
jgi:hypothetical protein